jgi:hypothetical protein
MARSEGLGSHRVTDNVTFSNLIYCLTDRDILVPDCIGYDNYDCISMR